MIFLSEQNSQPAQNANYKPGKFLAGTCYCDGSAPTCFRALNSPIYKPVISISERNVLTFLFWSSAKMIQLVLESACVLHVSCSAAHHDALDWGKTSNHQHVGVPWPLVARTLRPYQELCALVSKLEKLVASTPRQAHCARCMTMQQAQC